jgi:IPT/TIG domain-containing protein
MAQRYPLPITPAMLAPANQNIGKPRASTMADWGGGATGDDIDTASATVTLATASGAAPYPDYLPRTQADKLTAGNLTPGTTMVEDITRPRGWIAPHQPIVAKPAAPVVTSISPTTAPAAQLPLMVTITGTGFSVWSTVYTGGMPTPDRSASFVNATTMKVPIWAAAPGTISVAVMDHGVLSNDDVEFTVT